MIIVHIVERFAAGIAVIVKSVTEAVPDDVHIAMNRERKKEMATEKAKKKFSGQNVQFIKWRPTQHVIPPLKKLPASTGFYKVRRSLQKNRVDIGYLYVSKSGLPDNSYTLKLFNFQVSKFRH